MCPGRTPVARGAGEALRLELSKSDFRLHIIELDAQPVFCVGRFVGRFIGRSWTRRTIVYRFAEDVRRASGRFVVVPR